MSQFFAKDWTGAPFIWFGAAHNAALLLIVLLNIVLIWRVKGAPEKTKRTIAYTMAGFLWANELGWHLWNAFTGQWTIQTMLPLPAPVPAVRDKRLAGEGESRLRHCVHFVL